MVYYEPLYPSTAPNKLWTATRISTILHQEMYTGVTYYGKTRTKSIKINHKRKTIVLAKLPKDKWVKIPVPHLATIDRETFEAVHARKERNVRLQLRNNRHKYLMTEHLRCSCGRSIGGYKDTRGNPRYKCRTYWNSSEAHCIDKEHSITCSKIDNLVWDWICNLLSDEQALEEGLNKMIEGNKDETGDKRNKLEKLKNLITKHENSIERLINELSEGIYDDEFTRKIFQEKINENKEVIKELQKGRKQLEAELAQVELTEDFRQEIHSIAAQVRDNLVGASWEQKRAVMDKLDLKAVFRYNDGDRLLDLSCSLSPEGLSYDLQENNLL